MRLKIALVGDYPFDPEHIHGGVPMVMYTLIEGLKTFKDLDIHVVTCKKDIRKAISKKLDNVTVYFLPEQKRFGHLTMDFLDILKIRHQLNVIKPDVIHAFEQYKYGWAALNTNFSTLLEVTTITEECLKHQKGWIWWLRKKKIRLMEKKSFEKARHILVISQYVADMIRARTQAVFHHRFNPVKEAYFNLNSQNFVSGRILVAGRLTRSKGMHVVIRAMRVICHEYPDATLHIAGDTAASEYYRELRTLVDHLQLQNRVKFLGLLNEDSILKEYEDCNIVVMPSFVETFGLVAAQGMAAGKPVVAGRVGGAACYIEDGKTGVLFDPGNAQQLAEKVIQLFGNPQEQKRMGIMAREAASKLLRMHTVAKLNYGIYSKILG